MSYDYTPLNTKGDLRPSVERELLAVADAMSTLGNTGGPGGTAYVLPKATAIKLGGVMAGDDMVIEADGKIHLKEKPLTQTVADTLYDAKGAAATAKSEAITAAATDAQSKADAAKTAAISSAAIDATTKANKALVDAKAYADTKVVSGGNSSYTLPPATKTTIGGVIAGNNVDIDSSGKISVVTVKGDKGDPGGKGEKGEPGIPGTGATYTLPKASDTILGGIKVGEHLTIDPDGVVSVDPAGLGGSGSGGSSSRVFASWDDMKKAAPTSNGEYVWLQSYQKGNAAHGCGWFKGSNVGTGSYPDDGGVICRGTTFAWVRQYSDDNQLTIWDFGAWGDGDNANKDESWKSDTELDIGNKVHDDGPAMLAMWKYISNNSRSSVYDSVGVRLPAGSFGVTKVDFGTSSSFRIQGPYTEYGRQPTAYIIALEPNQDDPLLYWKATSSSISGIQFDGRSGICKTNGKPRAGYIGSDQYGGVRSKKDLWPDPNENGGAAKKRAYVKDLIDPTKGAMQLWGKQPIIEIGHQGAGYLNVKSVSWKRIGGAGITWYDAIDTKFDQVYSSDTYATVINSSWSNYAGGSWDHATAVEICNANFQSGFLKPVLSIPRCAQSLIRNVWLEHSEYPGNLSNGHWMIDTYCQEDTLNCIDVRNSRILIRHLDSIDNTYYNNPRTDINVDKYGGYASSVFLFGRLSGHNPTEKRNPNDPVVYADGTPVPADKIDVTTLGNANQVKAYNDAVAAGKTGADLDKYLITNNRNWDLNYGFLSAYEDGMHQIESQYQRSTGSMKYGWLSGQRLPSNPDVTDDYWVFLCSIDNQQISTPEGKGVYNKGHGLIEIDLFTKSDATNPAQTDDPTASGVGGMTRIKIQRFNDKSVTTYYSEGQSGILDIRSNNWGGPSIYVKLDKNCSSAVAFARSSGTTHDNAGSNFLLNWQLKVVDNTEVASKATNVGKSRLDLNNGTGNAGIGLSGKHVTLTSTSEATPPTGTATGVIEVMLNGNLVKIPYYV